MIWGRRDRGSTKTFECPGVCLRINLICSDCLPKWKDKPSADRGCATESPAPPPADSGFGPQLSCCRSSLSCRPPAVENVAKPGEPPVFPGCVVEFFLVVVPQLKDVLGVQMGSPPLRAGICEAEVTVDAEGRFSSVVDLRPPVGYNVSNASWGMMLGWNGESADWYQLSWRAKCRGGMWRHPLFVSFSSDVTWPTVCFHLTGACASDPEKSWIRFSRFWSLFTLTSRASYQVEWMPGGTWLFGAAVLVPPRLHRRFGTTVSASVIKPIRYVTSAQGMTIIQQVTLICV